MATQREPSETFSAEPLSWPTGKTPSREDHRLSQAEVAAIADFGRTPSEWFLAPQYAWRVAVRQRALKARVRELNAELEQAENERDQRLADMVIELRPTLEADARRFRLLESVRAAEGLARERSERLASSNAAYGDELRKLDLRREEVERRLASQRTVAEERSRALAQVDHELKRTEAQLNRVRIELRNATQPTEQVAVTGGGGASANQDQQVSELQQRASTLAHKVEELRAQTKSAQFDLELVQGEIEDLEKEQRRANAQREDLDRRYGKEHGARSVTVRDAERIQRQALADAGREFLAERDTSLLAPRTLGALRTLDEKVHRLARIVELHVAALDAFDGTTLRRGRALAAAVMVGLPALVCAIILLF
jgi:chromosome segregation ATPase